jgi:predicted transcriptional regulator
MNPFIQNIRIPVVKVVENYYEAKTYSINDGVIPDYKTISSSFLMEQQDKILVYDIPYIENVLFSEIKSSGRDLFLYIVYNLKKEEDFIDLKPEKVCNKMGISRATYYNAIQQLNDIAILCKKHTTTYWINPKFLYKGNRLRYYKRHIPDALEEVAVINNPIKTKEK